MASGVIKGSEIHTGSFNATTDGQGRIIQYSVQQNRKILNAWCTNNSSYIVIPFLGNGQYWYFKVLSNSDMAPVTQTKVDIVYTYTQ